MRMRHIVICGLPRSKKFFYLFLRKAWCSEKSYWIQNVYFDFLRKAWCSEKSYWIQNVYFDFLRKAWCSEKVTEYKMCILIFYVKHDVRKKLLNTKCVFWFFTKSMIFGKSYWIQNVYFDFLRKAWCSEKVTEYKMCILIFYEKHDVRKKLLNTKCVFWFFTKSMMFGKSYWIQNVYFDFLYILYLNHSSF